MSGQDLARAVLARRKVELGLSQEQVRARSGISTTTQSKIEHGGGASKTTLRRLDLALEWELGTAQSWAEGRGGLLPATTPAPVELDAMVDLLLPLIVDRLRAGTPVERLATKLAALPPPVVVALEGLVDQLIAALSDGGGR